VLDAPTITEAGFPDLDHGGLIGVFGPRGMPLDLRRRVGADIVEAGKQPEIIDRLNKTAQLPAFAGPEDLERSIAEMAGKLDGAAKTLGLRQKQ
jgi:tripartite-type tricarboxylate transporter receptor subunit TctC